MRIVGIIAEYNPFHNGHAYLIREAKRLTSADAAVIVMSGDFVQRGTPALFDKYLRTRMALAGGADLVLELPVACAAVSAQRFAEGAIAILDGIGADYLCFGSEAGELTLLDHAASVLAAPEDSRFSALLQQELRQGKSFPAARAAALCETLLSTFSSHAASLADAVPSNVSDCCGSGQPAVSDTLTDIIPQTVSNYSSGQPTALDTISNSNPKGATAIDKAAIEQLLAGPNNALGIEYLTALKKCGSRMKPLTIKRLGSGYHAQTLSEDIADAESTTQSHRPPMTNFASASAIRNCLLTEPLTDALSRLRTQMPEASFHILASACEDATAATKAPYFQASQHPIGLTEDDFSEMLSYQLLRETADSLSDYLDISEDLAQRIQNLRYEFRSFSQFADLLKTRNFTRTQINRALLHILLDLHAADLDAALHPTEVRLLGFRKESAAVMHDIKKSGRIKLVTKLSAATDLHFNADTFAANLYESRVAQIHQAEFVHEYQNAVIIC